MPGLFEIPVPFQIDYLDMTIHGLTEPDGSLNPLNKMFTWDYSREGDPILEIGFISDDAKPIVEEWLSRHRAEFQLRISVSWNKPHLHWLLTVIAEDRSQTDHLMASAILNNYGITSGGEILLIRTGKESPFLKRNEGKYGSESNITAGYGKFSFWVQPVYRGHDDAPKFPEIMEKVVELCEDAGLPIDLDSMYGNPLDIEPRDINRFFELITGER